MVSEDKAQDHPLTSVVGKTDGNSFTVVKKNGIKIKISGKENELCFRYVKFKMLVGYLTVSPQTWSVD